ncbi:hypothetical protein IU459_36680 [Nocardia amamiensis]|uniref:Uncharacterized protein n=1 Tax=Nocardia amamiensis TaxID=404578 RepID=A0ABS0D4F0_9NOCA|nr:hypothetical protein [Nocardia amamiensis]MBF6303003.1 hypothetical protein [Nocardia amamiensis]
MSDERAAPSEPARSDNYPVVPPPPLAEPLKEPDHNANEQLHQRRARQLGGAQPTSADPSITGSMTGGVADAVVLM